MQKTTLRELAPWAVLIVVVVVSMVAHALNADPQVFQLLGTVAGICGGAILPRKSDPTMTTVTAGDPPTITTGQTT